MSARHREWRRITALPVLVGVVGLALAAGCVKPTPTSRALSLARQHRETEAIATLRADLKAHPDDLEARKLLVKLLAVEGDLGAARVEVGEIEKRLPAGDPTPWIELGHAYELAHKFDEALAAYDTAASIAPSSAAGPREGGLRCARWGEAEEARPRLEEATRRGANDVETWHALGLVRLNLGDLDGADAAYRRGLAVDPDSAENLLGLASVAVTREDPRAALAAYDALLAKRPRYAPAELGRAWALTKLGRRDEAESALDRAQELGASPAAIAKQREALRRTPLP